MVGTKQLWLFASSMAFVAGLVPVLRPFLMPVWAALAKGSSYDVRPERHRPRSGGKLVHIKRIALYLHWIKALLLNETEAYREGSRLTSRTDGSS